MAINALIEKLRSFAEAAKLLPPLRAGKPVNPSTIWRWTKRGVRARNGMLVRLESLKVGGTCCTSEEALLRFFRALSENISELPAVEDLRSVEPACEAGHSNRSS